MAVVVEVTTTKHYHHWAPPVNESKSTSDGYDHFLPEEKKEKEKKKKEKKETTARLLPHIIISRGRSVSRGRMKRKTACLPEYDRPGTTLHYPLHSLSQPKLSFNKSE